MVLPVRLARPDPRVRKARLALLVPRAPLVLRAAPPALLVRPARLVLLDQ
jgi:hypothetical protein